MPSVTLFPLSLQPFLGSESTGFVMDLHCALLQPQPRQGPRHVMFCAFLQDILWLWPFFQEMSAAHCCISLLRHGWKQHAICCWMECDAYYLNSPVFNTGVGCSCLVPSVPKLKKWYQAWESCTVGMCSAKFILLKGTGPSLKVWFPWLSYSSLHFLLLSNFSSGKLEAAPLSSMYSCTGLLPNWADCSQKTHPLFQAVLCTAGAVNWGIVSADVCLGKLSVLDCIQLSVFW